MWQLDNQTPFPAEGAWVRDHSGREIWQVVVKATYRFNPLNGAVHVATQQVPVKLVCEYRGEPGASSLRYETDFALEKSRTDVIVNGSAWAPGGKLARRLIAGFTVGDLTKTVQVTGKRYWRQGRIGLVPGDAEPFSRLPLIWENAYGGKHGVNPDTGFPIAYPSNPVGIGYYETSKEALYRPLPSVEYPNNTIQHWFDRPMPAGVGTIANHWSPRCELSGTHDVHWQQTRYPLPPEDQHPDFSQYAPRDQQFSGCIKGGELVRLIHLRPESDVHFLLPRLFLHFHTRFSGRPIQSHHSRITALIIEPDECRFSLIHQTDLPCQGWEDALLCTRIEMEPRI